jgi:DNA repair exonuclease SbcCD ATPase subunit
LDIEVDYLSIKNFKGVKNLKLDANGKNISVLGNNATYKSTCYDAYLWVMSGKNSLNRADFSIKPLDEFGNEIHFLETEVEVGLLVDGKPLKLKKILTENWVKHSGETEKTYKDNAIAYFFDEVPIAANIYKKKIDELIGEEVLQLLTNPIYFNQYYKIGKLTDWQSRRMLLFEICGEITDEAIIAANPKLSKLPEVLDGKSIDDRKAIIAQSIKKLNDQIEKIGPAINENTRLVPPIPIDYSATEAELKQYKATLSNIEQELSSAGNIVVEYRKKQQELFTLKSKLENAKSRIFKDANAERQKLIDEKIRLEGEKLSHKSNKSICEADMINIKTEIDNRNEKLQQLRNEWTVLKKDILEVQSSSFVEPDESEFSCPLCSQKLPEDAKESKIQELRVKFEENKKTMISNADKRLAFNKAAGIKLKSDVDELQKTVEDYKNKIEKFETAMTAIDIRIPEIDMGLQEDAAVPDYESDLEYSELSKKISDLQTEIDKPVEDTTADIRQRRQDTQDKIDSCNAILNNRDVVANANARIDELKKLERDLSNQKSRLDGQLNLITEFMKAKVNSIEDIMNSKFRHVRFKFFEYIRSTNSYNDMCVAEVRTNGIWVPYPDGNLAGKINAGIDIINALSDHYGAKMPLWVDNRESITDLVETESQIISLIKPEIRTAADRKKYSKLVVEVEE